MALRVLGPIEIDDGEQLSPRERKVLAALAIAGPRGSSASTLADALWGDDLPSTWPKQLQAIVGHIRRGAGADAVETTTNGYALRVSPGSVDAGRFEDLVDAARRHSAADEPERAAEAYRRALDLWRGEPFAELDEWEPAAAEISRLREMRETSEEELQGVRLACGEHRAVIADAERLVREGPYREERWCLLALANYQSGRQAEALATLREARRTLTEELGIDPGERVTALETAILRQDPALAPTRHAPRISEDCPYRGLSAYGPDDAEEYFGRDAEVDAVVERLDRRRFLALTGASGSGKSSLALAGVVPDLRSRGVGVTIVRPGSDELAAAVISAHGRTVARGTVVIDQFEELFGLGLSDAELETQGEALEAFVREGGCLLLTVRSDFLDRCAAIPALARLIAEGVHVVGPMSRDDLRLAIEGPATRAGLRLEPGLAELVLRDAQGATAALPLLSHALVETWLRREGSVLTVAGYEASGGIRGAIAQSADELYATLTPDERAICRSTMLRLVSRGPDGSAVRRRVSSGPLIEDRDRRDVLARLTRARLITAQDDSIVVAHEAIASAWPRLGSWLEEDAESARMTEQLTAATEQWAEAGMPDSDLWRGARLAAVEEWAEASRPRLTAEEGAFVEASRRVAEAEQRAVEARTAQDRRSNRRLRLALASVAVLLVASLAATGVAIAGGTAASRSADAARAAETDATIEALMSTSLALRGSERDVSALLAAEMWQRWPDDPRSRAALMGVVTASGGLMSTTYVDSESISGALIPGTSSGLLIRDGATLEVRDIETGRVSATSASPTPGFAIGDAVETSADGRRAALILYDDSGERLLMSVAVVDAMTLRPVADPVALDILPDMLAVDATGERVALVDHADATVVVVDVASGTQRRSQPFLEPGEQPEATRGASVAFAPDGAILLGTIHPEVMVLDPDTFFPVASVRVPEYSANADSVMTDDGILVASGERAVVAVDTTTRRLLWSQPLAIPKPDACAVLAASSAASTVYCGDPWGGITQFDLTTGLPTAQRFDPQLGATRAIGLTVAGTELLAVGAGTPSLSLWRTDGGGAVSTLGANGRVMLDGYGGADDTLVVAARSPDARYDVDLSDFSLWSPDADRTTLDVPGEMEGLGWAGRNLLMGFSQEENDIVAIDATSGELVEIDPVPDHAMRTWPTRRGERMYVTNYVAANGDAPAHGFVSVHSGETGNPLDLAVELGSAFPVWVSANEDDSLVAISRWIDGVATTGVFDGATGEVIVDGLVGATVTTITPDGELLAAQAGRIARHDLHTLAITGTLPGAHGEVNSLQVSRDGNTLLATANDETVTLYDLSSGIRLGDPIPASAPLIGQGALRPDGLQFVVNVADGIQVWDADPAHWFEAACRIAGRELSAEERATYLSSLPAQLAGDAACADVLG